VLVKTKEPKPELHVNDRNTDDLLDYLAKAGHVAREIAPGRFYKRLGMWCAWCDFLPMCLRDVRKGSGDFGETALTVQVSKPARKLRSGLFLLQAFNLALRPSIARRLKP
jgi:hypothetical protein